MLGRLAGRSRRKSLPGSARRFIPPMLDGAGIAPRRSPGVRARPHVVPLGAQARLQVGREQDACQSEEENGPEDHGATRQTLGLLALPPGARADAHEEEGRHTGEAWSWVIDISAVLMILFSITGMIILFQNRKKRLVGIWLTVLGVATPAVIYLCWVPQLKGVS